MKKLFNKSISFIIVLCIFLSVSMPMAFASEYNGSEIEQSMTGELSAQTEAIATTITESTPQAQAMLMSEATEDVINYPLNSIVVKKTSAVTGELLPGAVFEVLQTNPSVSGTSGTVIGRYTTDYTGVVVITGLEPGGYIVKEVNPPTNYLLSENSQQQAWLKADGTSIVELTFANYPYGSLLIKKVDETTNAPLANAIFFVTTGAGTAVGNNGGYFTTDHMGSVLIPNLKPGSYVVREETPPQGYILNSTPKTIQIGTDGGTYTLSFTNKPMGGLLIKKYSSISREPLAGAIFRITDINGAVVGEGDGMYTTDNQGQIYIPGLKPGGYKVVETKAPQGYQLNNNIQTIYISDHKIYTLEFTNEPLNALTISKMDGDTRSPLAGATIKITKADDTFIAEKTTDASGKIVITGLADGFYKVFETKAPSGYVLNGTVKLVNIIGGNPAYVEIFNYKLGGIQIKKVDAQNNKGLYGAVYEVRKMDGTLIGSNYTTDTNGNVLIPTLQPGWYTVTELVPPTGYQNSPQDNGSYYYKNNYFAQNSSTVGGYVRQGAASQNVQVVAGSNASVIFKDYKYAILTIKKIDHTTGRPLADVSFSITQDNGLNIGTYKTDANGIIRIVDMEPGNYSILETLNPIVGYDRPDGTPKTITLNWGESKEITFENFKLATVNIVKINDEGKAMADVVFMLLDGNKNVIKTGITDVQGNLRFDGLKAGTYYWQEIVPEGYTNSPLPTMFDLKWSEVKTINVTNVINKGQIQIIKVSDGNNNTTGHLDGERLSNATFVVKDENNRIIDTLTTDQNGSAMSKVLAYGHYTIWETQAPNGYHKNTEPAYVDISENGKIYDVVIKNKPLELGLTIAKTGIYETQVGDSFYYTISNVANTSNVAIANFNWVDSLPTYTVRLQQIETGVYSHQVNLTVSYRTNYNPDWRDWGSNIDTTQSSLLNFGNVLGQDEYVTEIRFNFGTVPEGFKMVGETRMYVTTLTNLENGQSFTNNIHLSGTATNDETLHAFDSWTIKVWRKWKPSGRLPKTGE